VDQIFGSSLGLCAILIGTEAANDRVYRPVAARVCLTAEIHPGTTGWDPAEVWRNRVRDARRDGVAPSDGRRPCL